MSSQLEFIMQLYMMNLLQQQQQQQQQLQQQQQSQPILTSPVKAKDFQTQTMNLSNLNRQNSQNTMCSSSRSSSPNSNLSPLPNTTQTTTTNCSATSFPQTPQTFFNPLTQLTTAQAQPMTQLLLNNLPPLTQFMLMQQQQQHQQQQQITSTNLLLTPTTPNSTSSPPCFSTPISDGCSSAQTALNVADAVLAKSNSTCAVSAPLSASASSLFFPSAFTAQYPFIAASSQSHFLQSSTVTSTPCSDSTLHPLTNDKSSNPAKLVSDVSAVAPDNSDADAEADLSQSAENDVDLQKSQTAECANLDEDAQVFSSLHSSSGNSSSTTGNSKLMCSGVMALETTSDSMEDSTQMPYTPEKSNNQINPSTSHLLAYKDTLVTGDDDDKSNVTPMTLKNAILTPPSSEQLSSSHGQTFESSSSAANTSTTASSSSTADSFLTEENLKHLRKNSSYLECENPLCRQENLREHFHCYEEPCKGKILSKKDDIIRHLKWHKKRKESLLLGFARFSSSDDCAPEYGVGCAYNWKQTHYHCIYEECPKVYVSTSDVQMHANFHRKNSEIVQEGFRRFRAHENCKIEDCPFYGKKTSHYHCCREGCNHTFKNKADMDKHKTYHMKDHQLIQDGFKKILKTEQCPFENCKFSTVSNHIHCVREGCNFILHSSTQMISHKRKHDRAEGEQNYQQFKSQRDSSEEESPKPQVKTKYETRASTSNSSSSTSTPLSSLSAEHFLARKRGRPPKKIQLPTEAVDSKRLKLEANTEASNVNSASCNPANLSLINPFMASNAVMDPNAPNLQLTHLMALFQLQNPLFYQNLYPGGISAANMANILGAAGVNGSMPNALTNNSNVKQELHDKTEFKE